MKKQPTTKENMNLRAFSKNPNILQTSGVDRGPSKSTLTFPGLRNLFSKKKYKLFRQKLEGGHSIVYISRTKDSENPSHLSRSESSEASSAYRLAKFRYLCNLVQHNGRLAENSHRWCLLRKPSQEELRPPPSSNAQEKSFVFSTPINQSPLEKCDSGYNTPTAEGKPAMHKTQLAETQDLQTINPSFVFSKPAAGLPYLNNDTFVDGSPFGPLCLNNSNDANTTAKENSNRNSVRTPVQYSGRVVKVEGDGRCLFRSLVTADCPWLQSARRDDFGRPQCREQAEEETVRADELRWRVVHLMRDNLHFYSQLEKGIINADQPVQLTYKAFLDRLEAMSKPSTMPGDLELNAVAMVMEKQILVLNTDLRLITGYGRERFPAATSLAIRFTRLGVDTGHYDAVILNGNVGTRYDPLEPEPSTAAGRSREAAIPMDTEATSSCCTLISNLNISSRGHPLWEGKNRVKSIAGKADGTERGCSKHKLIANQVSAFCKEYNRAARPYASLAPARHPHQQSRGCQANLVPNNIPKHLAFSRCRSCGGRMDACNHRAKLSRFNKACQTAGNEADVSDVGKTAGDCADRKRMRFEENHGLSKDSHKPTTSSRKAAPQQTCARAPSSSRAKVLKRKPVHRNANQNAKRRKSSAATKRKAGCNHTTCRQRRSTTHKRRKQGEHHHAFIRNYVKEEEEETRYTVVAKKPEIKDLHGQQSVRGCASAAADVEVAARPALSFASVLHPSPQRPPLPLRSTYGHCIMCSKPLVASLECASLLQCYICGGLAHKRCVFRFTRSGRNWSETEGDYFVCDRCLRT